MSSKNLKFAAFFTALLITLVFCGKAYAVKIIPPRLVLNSDVKIEHMFIKNNSDKTEIYRFKWKHIAMDKQGNVINLDRVGLENAPEGYRSLDKIVRFSPRRATLQPGQTQRVTFLISRPQNEAAGEYRSHFMVEREPKPNNQTESTQDIASDKKANDTAETGGNTSPVVSIDVSVSRAVPIYVLSGETEASLDVVNAEIRKNKEKTKPYQPNYLAHFRVQKTGNRSVIGVARIFCTSGDEEVAISKVSKLFAVYAEGEFRDEKVAVAIPPKGCSSYRIAIKGHTDDVMSNKLLANKTFN